MAVRPVMKSVPTGAGWYAPDWMTEEEAIASTDAELSDQNFDFSSMADEFLGGGTTVYHQYYIKHTRNPHNPKSKLVDAKNFHEVKATFLKYLDDPKCPLGVKNAIGVWLFTTILTIHKIRDAGERRRIFRDLVPTISKVKAVIPKGFYLQYRDETAVESMAIAFFIERFTDKDKFFILQMLNDSEVAKGLSKTINHKLTNMEALEDTHGEITEDAVKSHFLNWIRSAEIDDQRSNLLDVLLRYYPEDEGVAKVRASLEYGKQHVRNIYTNAQSSHDDEILESVSKAVEHLLAWNDKNYVKPPRGINDAAVFRNTVSKWFSAADRKDALDVIIERMTIDHTKFETPSGRKYVISDVVFAAVRYILSCDQATQKTVAPIFVDLLDGVKGLCATGYINRSISALQGLDEKFDITISEKKRLHAILSFKLGEKLKDASEEVNLGSFTSEFRGVYLKFIKEVVNQVLPTLDVPKSVISEHIIYIVKEIAGEVDDEDDSSETSIDLPEEEWLYDEATGLLI